MKVSPVASAVPQSVNPNEGRSVAPDRLARAKAIATGQEPAAAVADSQVERAQASIKRIRLKTQQSPDRHTRLEEVAPATTPDAPAPTEAPATDTLATTEQAEPTSEASKPLSPQFAALARQKREIQLERQKLEADKAALTTSAPDLKEYVSKADIKANALKVLLAEGVTYDQLTEQILAEGQGGGAELEVLRSEIKALKEGLDNQTKSLTDRDAQQETQALAVIKRDVEALVAQGDDFEMIREAGYAPKVVELIHRIYKETGEILDNTEAATLIEKELLEESLKFAKIKKVQSSLNPAQPKAPQTVQQDRPGTKTMRTLTNRDGVSSTSMSKRERAIAAMEGRLK